MVVHKELRKDQRVRVKRVVHGSPKLPVKFTEGMSGRVVGFRSLVLVQLDEHPKLKYYHLPEELEPD